MRGLVVITGGEGAIARALAAAFTAAGHPVLSPGRRELDVTDEHAVRAFFRDHSAELLICNAGITRDAPLARLDEAAWDEVMAVNLRGAAICAAAAARGMLRARCGHLVFISSRSALHPPHGQAAYAAAKAGLLGLARSLARELGPAGIRVNTILPGFLDTPMTAARRSAMTTSSTASTPPKLPRNSWSTSTTASRTPPVRSSSSTAGSASASSGRAR